MSMSSPLSSARRIVDSLLDVDKEKAHVEREVSEYRQQQMKFYTPPSIRATSKQIPQRGDFPKSSIKWEMAISSATNNLNELTAMMSSLVASTEDSLLTATPSSKAKSFRPYSSPLTYQVSRQQADFVKQYGRLQEQFSSHANTPKSETDAIFKSILKDVDIISSVMKEESLSHNVKTIQMLLDRIKEKATSGSTALPEKQVPMDSLHQSYRALDDFSSSFRKSSFDDMAHNRSEEVDAGDGKSKTSDVTGTDTSVGASTSKIEESKEDTDQESQEEEDDEEEYATHHNVHKMSFKSFQNQLLEVEDNREEDNDGSLENDSSNEKDNTASGTLNGTDLSVSFTSFDNNLAYGQEEEEEVKSKDKDTEEKFIFKMPEIPTLESIESSRKSPSPEGMRQRSKSTSDTHAEKTTASAGHKKRSTSMLITMNGTSSNESLSPSRPIIAIPEDIEEQLIGANDHVSEPQTFVEDETNHKTNELYYNNDKLVVSQVNISPARHDHLNKVGSRVRSKSSASPVSPSSVSSNSKRRQTVTMGDTSYKSGSPQPSMSQSLQKSTTSIGSHSSPTSQRTEPTPPKTTSPITTSPKRKSLALAHERLEKLQEHRAQLERKQQRQSLSPRSSPSKDTSTSSPQSIAEQERIKQLLFKTSSPEQQVKADGPPVKRFGLGRSKTFSDTQEAKREEGARRGTVDGGLPNSNFATNGLFDAQVVASETQGTQVVTASQEKPKRRFTFGRKQKK